MVHVQDHTTFGPGRMSTLTNPYGVRVPLPTFSFGAGRLIDKEFLIRMRWPPGTHSPLEHC